MRKFILVLSIILMMIMALVSLKFNKKTELYQQQTAIINKDINDTEKKLAVMENYQISASLKIEDVFMSFLNNIKIVADLNKVTATLKADKRKGDFEIDAYCIDSGLAGVKKLPLEMAFSSIEGEWAQLKLLKAFEDLEKQMAVEFGLVERNKDSLSFIVNLYGE